MAKLAALTRAALLSAAAGRFQMRPALLPVLCLALAASCASPPDLPEEQENGSDVQVWSAPVKVGTPKLSDPVEMRSNDTPDPEEEQRGEWVTAPIPFANPTLGVGLGVFGGYIFPLDPDDKTSPHSTVGAGGFYASNGSWGAFAGMSGYADEDTWRFKGGAFYGSFNLDFYGIGHGAGDRGEKISLNQKVTGGLLELMRSIGWKSFIGPRALAWRMETEFRDAKDWVELLPDDLLDARLVALGIRLARDSRDSVFYPTEGMLFDLVLDSYKESWGSDEQYDAWTASYNHYMSLSEQTVLAGRLHGRFSFGDVPYYGLSMFGEGGDLRGYNTGRYRDRMLLAGQAEVRHFLTEKFGAVGFAGVGAVAPTMSGWSIDELLPSVGVGLRYTIAEKNKVNFRLDVVWCKDGWACLLGIGEAF